VNTENNLQWCRQWPIHHHNENDRVNTATKSFLFNYVSQHTTQNEASGCMSHNMACQAAFSSLGRIWHMDYECDPQENKDPRTGKCPDVQLCQENTRSERSQVTWCAGAYQVLPWSNKNTRRVFKAKKAVSISFRRDNFVRREFFRRALHFFLKPYCGSVTHPPKPAAGHPRVASYLGCWTDATNELIRQLNELRNLS